LCRPESSFNWSGSSRAGLGRGEAGAQGGTQGVEWRTLQDPPDVTALLFKWAHGDETALERLIPVVNRELHHIARRCTAGERSGHSFQATALVNEAYMRLVDAANIPWQGRAHFLGVAARIMRRILVDHARARLSQKRGGQAVEVTFDEGLIVTDDRAHDIVALDVRWKRWQSSTVARAGSSNSDLFHAAQALPADERATFLAAASPGEDALRREVESLLKESDAPARTPSQSHP
jgi:RNA polymerase sigma factor (TIGR02999 family)